MLTMAVLSLAVVGGAAAAETPLVEWQELVVPGVCTLRVAVPQGWDAVLRSPLEGAVNVRLSPADGSHAEVLITGLVPKGDGSLASAGDLKRTARAMGEQMLSGAVEKRLELERVEGTDGSGFFYSLTDRRTPLPEGEYRHLVQGIMAVGPLRFAVTVLADGPDSAAKATALELMRTAECTAPEPHG